MTANHFSRHNGLVLGSIDDILRVPAERPSVHLEGLHAVRVPYKSTVGSAAVGRLRCGSGLLHSFLGEFFSFHVSAEVRLSTIFRMRDSYKWNTTSEVGNITLATSFTKSTTTRNTRYGECLNWSPTFADAAFSGSTVAKRTLPCRSTTGRRFVTDLKVFTFFLSIPLQTVVQEPTLTLGSIYLRGWKMSDKKSVAAREIQQTCVCCVADNGAP